MEVKKINSDVIVIGSGAAGLLTSIYLAKRGKKVIILTKGYGATAMSSGCFDILGFVKNKVLESFRDGFNELPDSHPYLIVSNGDISKLSNLMNQAINKIDDISSFLIGNIETNRNVITFTGTVKTTALIQKCMEGAIIEHGKQYLLLGFKGIYDYNPRLQARLLKTSAKIFGYNDIRIDAIRINLEITIPSIHYLNSILKQEKYKRLLIMKLEKIVNDYSPDAILIPAIFDDISRIKSLQEHAPIYETPSPPPYRAGIRLVNFLWRLARKHNVSVMHIDDLKGDIKGKEVIKLVAIKNDKEIEISSQKYILATGDLIGGGLKIVLNRDLLKKELVDTVFNLRVAKLDKNIFNSDLFGQHELNKIGFKINELMQPINERGAPILSNLHVVGSVIGGYDYNSEKSGLGVTLATSYKLHEELAKVI